MSKAPMQPEEEQSVENLIVEDLEGGREGGSKITVARSNSRPARKQKIVKRKQISWQRGKLIGSGGFGKVYLGLDKNSGALIAGKEFNFDVREAKQITMLAQLENEIKIMKELNHPNIVKYVGADKKGSLFYIFMEYVPGGSLRSLIDEFGPLHPRVAGKFTKHILLGLQFLHGHAVIHRDIKAANVLVNVEGVVKLADFGSAQHLTQTTGMHGTPFWMAPEVVSGKGPVDFPADVWSLGCTVMEILTGKPPFHHLGNGARVMGLVGNGGAAGDELTIPTEIHDADARDFITQCLQRDPQKRPKVSTLLDHPFVTPPKRPPSAESWMSSVSSFGGSDHILTSSATPSSFPSFHSTIDDATQLDPVIRNALVKTAYSHANGNPLISSTPIPTSSKELMDSMMSVMHVSGEVIDLNIGSPNVSDTASNDNSVPQSPLRSESSSQASSKSSSKVTFGSNRQEGCTTMKKVQITIVVTLVVVLGVLSALLATRQ